MYINIFGIVNHKKQLSYLSDQVKINMCNIQNLHTSTYDHKLIHTTSDRGPFFKYDKFLSLAHVILL